MDKPIFYHAVIEHMTDSEWLKSLPIADQVEAMRIIVTFMRGLKRKCLFTPVWRECA
jgi:hypothetical protein